MRFRLRTLLILAAAAPIWTFLIVGLPQSPGFGGNPLRFVVVPLALSGIAAAIYRLTRTLEDGFAIAVFLSPIIAFGVLMCVTAMAR
jgi:hypothetical protein